MKSILAIIFAWAVLFFIYLWARHWIARRTGRRARSTSHRPWETFKGGP